MASIHKEILIQARPQDVWAAIRDVGAVHQRLAPGFVIDARLDGDARIVTFADGAVVRELLVDIDDEARRVAYAAIGGRTTHHNASMQVFLQRGKTTAGSSGSPTCCPMRSPQSSMNLSSRAQPL